jgi:hypothetical protein
MVATELRNAVGILEGYVLLRAQSDLVCCMLVQCIWSQDVNVQVKGRRLYSTRANALSRATRTAGGAI